MSDQAHWAENENKDVIKQILWLHQMSVSSVFICIITGWINQVLLYVDYWPFTKLKVTKNLYKMAQLN